MGPLPSPCLGSRQITPSLRAISRNPGQAGLGAMAVAGFASAMLLLSSPVARAQTGTLSTLYSFTGGADGEGAVGGVVADAAGTLYGETDQGGSAACTSHYQPPRYGCGTVYAFNQTMGLKVLATFTGANGAHGNTTLTLVGSTLYGATTAGGTSDDGVVFSVNTDGSNFTVLHQFIGTDGKYPVGTLRVGQNGVVYGLTEYGGTRNYGVLYSVTPGGAFSVLHDFLGGKDGRDPGSLLISPKGVLVGSTFQGGPPNSSCGNAGCGTIFVYAPQTGSFQPVYEFDSSNGFGGAIGALGPGPTVYGADVAAPFSVTLQSGTKNIGYFPSGDGVIASGPLLSPKGKLVGVTGDGIGSGTLYSASGNLVTNLAYFGDDGTDPLAQPILRPGGVIIGTASQNGLCPYCGTIWQYTP